GASAPSRARLTAGSPHTPTRRPLACREGSFVLRARGTTTPTQQRGATAALALRHAQLAAFAATRRPGVQAADDPQVAALRESGAPVVTLVAKSHDRHVRLALRTTLDENLAMIRDTVSHLR